MFSRIETSTITASRVQAAMAYRSSASPDISPETDSLSGRILTRGSPPDHPGIERSRAESEIQTGNSISISLDMQQRIRAAFDFSGSSKSRTVEMDFKFDFTARATQTEIQDGSIDPKLEKDLEFILRTLARDDKEFRELKSRFKNLLTSISSSLKSMSGSISESVSAGSPSAGRAVHVASMKELSVQISIEARLKTTATSMLPLGSSTNIQIGSSDPLVIDLDGDGLELSAFTDGPRFDILGKGVTAQQVAWVKPDDGFLVLDRNGNGIIDSGLELFGEQNGASNGIEELARFDSDNNGIIDKRDMVFNRLRVFRDVNQDGYSQSGELHTLKQLDISSISLSFRSNHNVEIAGNPVPYEGWYSTSDGRKRAMGEVFLDFVA
ncbi:MAG: hypothetical protein CVV64_08295 [Candidatus Wallbacteria bacterium HGW-Wallbacteria-1]|uniref:EF-hand domain-containing protein n=1 Tax=Candidatus Wallbacteria bacterium HGW-Wallbacteria-1 TaxID=2013854 RepID=A0A2N1PRB1_9BACT|nr:MAG: hypothetical protein CVV64_08295 [Candidatus Wallbacteria bacterium HGW-Wallbacteria-1]